jgi:twitching motility protein PilT
MRNYINLLKNLLDIVVEADASDLHISSGNYPAIRIQGELCFLTDLPMINGVDSLAIANVLMNDKQIKKFQEEKEIDFSYAHTNDSRFRVNVFTQRGDVSCALRFVPKNVKTIEDLNLPSFLHHFTRPNQGFVLITGPSSHGKSTTLAAMIDEINTQRFEHIVTIEDPIEYIFNDKKSIVDQREVYQDTNSFSRSLKSVFRQDPDVIMVGEMRDPETIATTITAAETGHLVFSTLHTNSAAQTINRIVDSFPAAQQNQIKAQLAGSLLGIVSQRLLPSINGGVVPACEIMINNSATANLIRESKVHQIDLVLETSAEEGMISLNKSLLNLLRAGEVTTETALAYSPHPAELRKLIG